MISLHSAYNTGASVEVLDKFFHLQSSVFIIIYVLKMCNWGNIEGDEKITSLQALSSKESSEQKEFEDAVRPELTDEEKQRIEDEQLKQKAISEKDLVSHRFCATGEN